MNTTRISSRLSFGILVSATLLFLGIHLSALIFGPRLGIMQDELNFLYEALRIPSEGRLSAYGHGPFLFELIALFEGIFYIARLAVGFAETPVQFLAAVLHHEGSHLLALRGFLSLTSLALLVQIYRLGKIVRGPLTGSLAVLLCASNLTFHLLTTMVKEDAIYWLLLFTVVIMVWNGRENKNPRTWYIAGLLLGVTTATKYLAIFSYPIILLPFFFGPRNALREKLRAVVIFGLVTATTTLLLVPFVFTDAERFFYTLNLLEQQLSHIKSNILLPVYLHTHLPNLLGWTVFLVGAFELFRQTSREWRGPALLGLAFFPPLIALGLRSGYHCSHYVFPAGMFLSIYACALVEQTFEDSRSTFIRWAPVVSILALALAGSSFFRGSLKYLFILTGGDTRLEAQRFIHENAVPNQRILVTTAIIGDAFYGPPLHSTGKTIGKGKFGEAKRLARQRNTDPAYDVSTMSGPVVWEPGLKEAYDWIVVPTYYPVNILDDMAGVSDDQEKTPEGFSLATTFTPVPEPRSNLFPCTIPEDYDMYRNLSLKTAWNQGKIGHKIKIYRATDEKTPVLTAQR